MPPISNHPFAKKGKGNLPEPIYLCTPHTNYIDRRNTPPPPSCNWIDYYHRSVPFPSLPLPNYRKKPARVPSTPLRNRLCKNLWTTWGHTLARGVSNHPIKFRWKFVRAKNCGGQRDSSSRQDSRTWNPGTYVPASHYHTCHQAPLALYSAGAPSFPYLATSGVPSPAPLLTHASAFEIRGDNVTWSSEEIMEKYFRLFRRIQAIAGWSGVRSRWWLGYQENWLWGNGYLFFQMKMKYSTFQWNR